MVDTVEPMATDKPKRGRPLGRTPTYTIHTGIDLELGDAIEAFVEDHEFPPRMRHIVETALRAYLSEKGYWPPKKKNGKHA